VGRPVAAKEAGGAGGAGGRRGSQPPRAGRGGLGAPGLPARASLQRLRPWSRLPVRRERPKQRDEVEGRSFPSS